MSAIWRNNGSGWNLLAPTGFPNEAALHSLVEEAPQVLPLAGSPNLVIVGREVLLGSGYADLIGVEPNGRLVVIEVKLAKNSEARRAVVAQILTYASYLHGLDASDLETTILGSHLQTRNYMNLADAVQSNDQQGSFDYEQFHAGLKNSLNEGRFRLVMVLDDAPEELVHLSGYLQLISDRILIDLVRVSSYEIHGSRVLVPQRVDAENPQLKSGSPPPLRPVQGQYSPGSELFEKAIGSAPAEDRANLNRLAQWAKSLEQEGLVSLGTFRGTSGRLTLLPRLSVGNAGLVTIATDSGGCLWTWRSVFNKRAPQSVETIERLLQPKPLSQGAVIKDVTDELLAALTGAYREAAQGNS